MMQKTVQSFKITDIRQLNHEGMVIETENPVTRQQLAKVLSETILGVDIKQFKDHWAGNLEIDINIFQDGHDDRGEWKYFANVYQVETDAQGMTHNGDCIADFEIELHTDRNTDILLQCENCGEILTHSELEDSDDYEADMSDYRNGCEPGSIIPFGEHRAGDCWGMIHEFEYSKLVKEPEPIKVWVSIDRGEFFDAYTTYANSGKVEIEVWDWDNIRQADRKDEANEAWGLAPWSPETIKKTHCEFESEICGWGAWPEAAKVYYCGEPWPFTIINGTKIGAEEMKQQMFPDGENPLGPEAEALDEEFGYYVPFFVMLKGDQAVYDHIKTEIDDQFPGERP